jgi:NAD+ diphosphatase
MPPQIIMPGLSAQTTLNRTGEKRSDRDFIASRFQSSDARILLLLDLKVPILPSPDAKSAELRWLAAADFLLEGRSERDFIYLGEGSEGPIFAGNTPGHRLHGEPHLTERLSPLVDVRSLALQNVLTPDSLQIAAQARALCAWTSLNLCCGRCGGRTSWSDGGWRRRCFACGLDHYPRTDPAVIMLVTHDDLCLLGHEHRFPDKFYSVLAGFIEPGDDIENAVRREVTEEAGIVIGEVHYVASQPWPFPHSLMVGCWGKALSRDIRVDVTELGDVRWFPRSEVEAMIENRHPDGLYVPAAISMAHTLIRGYLDRAIG